MFARGFQEVHLHYELYMWTPAIVDGCSDNIGVCQDLGIVMVVSCWRVRAVRGAVSIMRARSSTRMV